MNIFILRNSLNGALGALEATWNKVEGTNYRVVAARDALPTFCTSSQRVAQIVCASQGTGDIHLPRCPKGWQVVKISVFGA